MLEKVSLQKSCDRDREFLFELYCGKRSEEFAVLGLTNQQLSSLMSMQFDAQAQSYRVEFPEAEEFLVMLDSEKIGRLIIARNDLEIRLVDITILSKYRSLGIGGKLIEELLHEGNSRKIPVCLMVATDNPRAFRLYERLGFVVVSQNEMYSSMVFKQF